MPTATVKPRKRATSRKTPTTKGRTPTYHRSIPVRVRKALLKLRAGLLDGSIRFDYSSVAIPRTPSGCGCVGGHTLRLLGTTRKSGPFWGLLADHSLDEYMGLRLTVNWPARFTSCDRWTKDSANAAQRITHFLRTAQ